MQNLYLNTVYSELRFQDLCHFVAGLVFRDV